MAKASLVSGSIWDEYSNIVVDRMNNPQHQGHITEEEAEAMNATLIVADFGAESCGDAVRLYWAVENGTDKIVASKFKSFGCGTAIASSDIMTELCMGKTVDEAVKITNIDVEKAMRDTPDVPAVPPQKMHCSVMAYDVIKKAAATYKGVDAESFEEEFIICECARVSQDTLVDVIKINDLKTIEEIIDFTKAGGFCKSCIKAGGHEAKDIYLEDLLKETREEMERERLTTMANAPKEDKADFASMSMVQKTRAIDAVVEEYVRPMLIMDGGDMELVDIKEENGNFDVYIKYLGACSTCSTGSTGTLYAIESTLKQNLDDRIRVITL
ncbi:iron-sulfur cluster assembly scaffold protein [Sulfurimonas sp. C5]|uniref:iron-sulfur cluster assembly scaffold protein n=1 Tax=Sulfurimonas sp. C5 TaxID=3036947 RepID=UPI00245905D9|nr:iron-sulfur cluster assembly scaffold protein [Sulfurimonas sp. C5]MDH4945485.1 iron-sulfur cluster assembly scaffold protein [Sulfurimonas sp. C5]